MQYEQHGQVLGRVLVFSDAMYHMSGLFTCPSTHLHVMRLVFAQQVSMLQPFNWTKTSLQRLFCQLAQPWTQMQSPSTNQKWKGDELLSLSVNLNSSQTGTIFAAVGRSCCKRNVQRVISRVQHSPCQP
jgi:hypothetical protein